MVSLDTLSDCLKTGAALDAAQVEQAVVHLADGTVDPAAKERFLTALGDKGETPAEIAAFAVAFRSRSIEPGVSQWSADAVDIVGTGGDHAGGFNISSLVVLTLASLGVKVMKHGNRGVTSKCGSADLLSALGVELEAPAAKVRAAIDQLGFGFFFAPAYHPAFRHIAPVRKSLAAKGRRTVFNILGPLINPGRPAYQILGVFDPKWVTPLAGAMEMLGVKAGLAGYGKITEGTGIDEFTTSTDNLVSGAGRLSGIREEIWTPESHGFSRRPFDELKGGDLETNLAIVQAVLAGHGPAGLVDTIVYNAALAMWLCGRAKTPADAYAQAREALVGGAVAEKIKATREFFGK